MNDSPNSNRLPFLSAVILTAGLWVPFSSFAAPADLDDTLDSNGKLTIDFAGGSDYGYSVAVQSDGNIVVAGSAWNPTTTNRDFAVARYEPDGTPDDEFGTNGLMTTDFSGGQETAWGVVIQSDGKIVVAGSVNNGTTGEFGLVRYKIDGTVDSTFGTTGKTTTDFGGFDEGFGVALQTDDKILVVGITAGDFAIARYTKDGNLDDTFNTDGKTTIDFDGGYDLARSVFVQPNGNILVAGTSHDGASNDFALAKFNSFGNLDGSFDNDGKVTTDVSGGSDHAYAVTAQNDGKILVAGDAGMTGVTQKVDFAIVRYTSGGKLDGNFDGDGIVLTDFSGENDEAQSIAIQPDGKILVAGSAKSATDLDTAVARYLGDGSPDDTFGTGGIVTTDVTGHDDLGESVVLDATGKILVAGYADITGISAWDFSLVRYEGDPLRYQPDNHIGLKIRRQKGNNIYNPSGAGQKVRVVSKNGKKIKLFVTVQNDGNQSDDFIVRGTRKNKYFSVKYLYITNIVRNVTGTMTGKGLPVSGFPGSKSRLRAEIKPDKGISKRRTFRILTISKFPAFKDAVKAKVKAKK